MQTMVKCLIVDDREENLRVLAALLRQEGLEVLSAQSGPAALELLLRHDVALALLDVQMPEMDGFELAELMRGSVRTRNVPIIFITAGASHKSWTFKGYDSGAVDFLYKPIDPHILKSKADVFFQLYRQKQQLAEELHERSEALRLSELFIAVLGHDLRNPLSAIMNYAYALESESHDETVLHVAERIRACGSRMSRMIEDLVDLVRTRVASTFSIQRTPSDLGPLIERIAEEQRTAFPGQQVELRQTGDMRGTWDVERLAQVASNLLGNAIQHGEENGIVQVELDGTRAGFVVLTVVNAGTIPAELLPHIFQPFRGGRRAPGRSEGLGLGLYIVQQIVHAHEGSVDVQSADGRTTFRVHLPRTASSDSAAERAP